MEESRLELILHCLSTPEPTICLEQLDWSGISPDELAAILDSERIAFIDKAIIISILFKSIGPRESGFFFDTAIQMMSGPPSAHYRLFESAMGILSSTDPAWVHWFLNGLVPGDLFFEDGTGLMIMVLNPVENLPDTLWEMMKEGGLGEWGGEGEQVNLAFSASIRHLIYTTPESALEYAKEAIQSMSMSDEAAVSMAQSAVFYASVLARKHPEVDSLALEELLTALLTSPNTELPAAVQFVSLFKDQPFPGLRAGVSDRYLREAMAIVERR